ncbi:hypothetical protein [Pleomorphovibrio marinus]|uniref:hypothetical protein n=1 Tax=Pleomorphovibrio marinus TaxID=2164132 RepID=UPI000E0BCB96|nr:hypothetical protein [Pleomorphovibrio marinus]
MRFYIEFLYKLLFLLSILPFLISEKFNEKYAIKVHPQVVDTLYSSPAAVKELENKEIDEASGLAHSWLHPDILYTHNDSGGEPFIYMIDTLGDYRGKILLEGVDNRDWEDIAVGPGPNKNTSYVYVGEIGDNYAQHEQIFLYRFEEPKKLTQNISITPEIITLNYPDGPRDAETLMVDPQSGDLFILTKRDSSNTLYRANAAQINPDTEVTLEKIGKYPITMSTGGDISKDGSEILVKNYWVVYHWNRMPGETIPAAMRRDPVLLPYNPEPQGEAITFSSNGHNYYTLSEKRMRIQPVLYKYSRVQ